MLFFKPQFRIITPLICVFFIQITFSQSQTFNSSSSFTVPTNVTKISVEAWGGGGKGGTRTTDGTSGGGGGGAYSKKVLTVVPSEVYTVTVGSGSSSTSPGGDSQFFKTSTPSTILTRAKGGNSVANNSNSGANGGLASASIGDVKYSGGSGADGGTRTRYFFIFPLDLTYGGGGGSSAGTTLNGVDATIEYGAIAPLGGGNGGDGAYSWLFGSDVSKNGVIPGGGGGGAYKLGGGTVNGANGANGRVIICSFPINAGNITGSSNVCLGQNSVSYSIPAISNATSYAWSYSGSGITISNGSSNAITINFSSSATSGILTAYGVNACGNGNPSTNFSINVNQLPLADFSFSVNPSNNGEVSFTNTSTNGTSYLWDFGDSSTSTLANPTHTYSTSGVYSITLRSTNSCGFNEITKLVTVDNTLGIDDEILSSFTMYPNPVTSNEIKLTIPNEIEAFEVTISSILGQKINSYSIKNKYNDIHKLPINNYKTGVYFITISTENGKATKKLIVN